LRGGAADAAIQFHPLAIFRSIDHVKQKLWIAASAAPPRNDGVWGMSAGGGDEGCGSMGHANFNHHKVFALLSAVAERLIKNSALH